jgi:hypothetical protein
MEMNQEAPSSSMERPFCFLPVIAGVELALHLLLVTKASTAVESIPIDVV